MMDVVHASHNEESFLNPLVFAVDAISGVVSTDHSLFNKLLKALASSSLEDESENSKNEYSNSNTEIRSRRAMSLFRPDDDAEADDSSIDEFFLEYAQTGSSGNRRGSGRLGVVNFGTVLRSGTSSGANNSGGINSSSGNRSTSTTSFNTSLDGQSATLAYAKTLNSSRPKSSFFRFARIVPVSSRYGFPPSKDPLGSQNLAQGLHAASRQLQKNKTQPTSQQYTLEEKEELIRSVLMDYKSSLSGILPSGWFDKHSYALPSAILVVCTVTSNRTEQAKQDSYLYETVEHLQYSLVPKRRCPIQIVALVHDDVSSHQADVWTVAVNNELNARTTAINNSLTEESGNTISNIGNITETQPQVSIIQLRVSTDLETSIRTTIALKNLYRATRDASLLYYLRQARRTREKLLKIVSMNEDRTNNNMNSNSVLKRRIKAQPTGQLEPHVGLSPVIIRYCIKVAMFYEFQMTKHEKSVLFLTEAYKHVMKYYEHLLLRESGLDNDDTSVTSTDPFLMTSSNSNHGNTASLTDGSQDDEGVEVEFTNDSSSSTTPFSKALMNRSTFVNIKLRWAKLIPAPPDDMLQQCRAIADWLNFKLIKIGLESKTDAGLLAFTNQWRQHSRIFGTVSTRKQNYVQLVDHDTSWYDWLCISRQRKTICQLLEKYQPKLSYKEDGLAACDSVMDEIKILCSLWRSYVSATEATLQLGREVERRVLDLSDTSGNETSEVTLDTISSKKDAIMRQRYIGGGIATETLAFEFDQERLINHKEQALELILTAIAYFEEELQRENRGFYAENSFNERCSSRTGARIYYLAGGILLGMNRHELAANHLVKAANHSQGWRELELSIRRMLIECYEKHIPSSTSCSTLTSPDSDNSDTLVSIILDSYFNAELSSRDLRRALSHFASFCGGENLKWYHTTTGEENNSRLPFTFLVSFPGKTHAVAGDTVQCSIMIKSNLDYAIHVNSVQLKTLAGNLPIASTDLLSATNVSEGSEGGIIIQAQTAIVVSTNVKLPRDLSKIASDDRGNGGEQSGTAGKGSFAKSARPRSAGITAAGGARLVSEDKLLKGNRNSQGWNLRYLGGKPLLCDGLHIVFYPVQAEMISSSSSDSLTLIELTIEKKSSRTTVNIKRTPFEEENYIASAWARPCNLALSSGPRSIRVLSPQAQLVVTNVTEGFTHGNVLEGTVNRILLKMQAGSQERCSNINIAVSCFSVLVTPSGTTMRLVSQSALETETENSVNMNLPCFRTPSIVSHNNSNSKIVSSGFGYDLPKGWSLAGTGQSYSYSCSESLKEGESSFVCLDLFRPATVNMQPKDFESGSEKVQIEDLADYCLCKTDYYVTITYQQERPTGLKQKIVKRSIRRRPQMGTSLKGRGSGSLEMNECVDADTLENTDEVSLEKTGTVLWISPLSATFSSGSRVWHPSGRIIPTKLLDDTSNSTPQTSTDVIDGIPAPLVAVASKATNNASVLPTMNWSSSGVAQRPKGNCLVLYDGECFTSRCSLQLDPSMDSLETEIVSIRFEDNCATDSGVRFTLLTHATDSEDDGIIYKPNTNDPCRNLRAGSKLRLSFTVQAKLNHSQSSASSLIGNLLVDWLPSMLNLPSDHGISNFASLGYIKGHGPLALDSPSTIRFRGPLCFVDTIPFTLDRHCVASEIYVGCCFDINYQIINNTTMHQVLRVSFDHDTTLSDHGFLITGISHGEIHLSPFEKHTMTFTVLPVHAGELTLPMLHLESDRYKSWSVMSGRSSNQIFVLP